MNNIVKHSFGRDNKSDDERPVYRGGPVFMPDPNETHEEGRKRLLEALDALKAACGPDKEDRRELQDKKEVAHFAAKSRI